MKRASNLAILIVVSASIVLAATQTASAQRRWRRARTVRHRPSPTTHVANQSPQTIRLLRPLPANYYYYPKYTGAFHARYYDDIPSIYGTRPVRGTAW